ncbi:MAG: PHP domain-containing protein [Planctomycetes bacterium]|nr:PHP domain-containing protein [Planctomycetota bacterium]MBI3846066.1 PHP domain-containing protein [Planctomycetota bacterium]
MALSLVDLHTHTTASDGTLPPAKLVAEAKRAGLRVLAVTDHDTLAALDEAEAVARRKRIEFVPGVELTAYHRGHEIHLLAYWVRRGGELEREMLRFRARRLDRMKTMIAKLRAVGLPVRESDVIRPGMGAVGRPHLARALVRLGHARDVSDAFARLIGTRCPAYVRKYRLSMKRALRLVRESNGVSVIAHPGKRGALDPLFAELKDLGLHGIEAYHSSHDRASIERYVAIAKRMRLIVTGGSDFHGEAVKPGITLGCVRVPLRVVGALRRAADA